MHKALVILRASEEQIIYDALTSVGIQVNQEAQRTEERIGRCCTPTFITESGESVIRILLSDSEMEAIVPYIEGHSVMIDWDSSIVDENGDQLPELPYSVEQTDEDGNTITVSQPMTIIKT